MVFAWAQFLMDLQPLLVLVTGEGHLHGFSHTYIGASLIGVAAALSGKCAAEFGLRFLELSRYLPVLWPVVVLSALIGSYSHVLLDSLMHADLQPFAPFSLDNPFLGVVSIEALHQFCVYSGAVGAAVFFGLAHWRKRRLAGPDGVEDGR